MKVILLLCECRLGGGSTCRWWGHLNTRSRLLKLFELFALASGEDSKI